jgi:serine/threonine protein kinase/DNA-binding winged helix-turn-helix (wHTH) protein
MGTTAERSRDWDTAGRVWRFSQYEFDEFSRELRSGGVRIELEAKPLEVLYQLLLHAGEVVTQEELLEFAWPGVAVADGSLATAVAKLRAAFGGENPPIVLTVAQTGYRLAVPAECRRVSAPAVRNFDFRPGDPVPGREHLKLIRVLDASHSSQVWLAENSKTQEVRVIQFAGDGIRLNALKREVRIARLLKDSLGERSEFVRVLGWNFDTSPFYLEREFCGPNLAEWADEQGGLTVVPRPVRLQILVELAKGVAAAHEIGVLHRDLKPANVLMAPRPGGGFQVKVAHFGSGPLMERSRLSEPGMTNLGLTQTGSSGAGASSGTSMYLPPEVLSGQSPTTLADIYAVGVLLYQLLAGDFRKPLSPGWEADIDDPLLRENIADAARSDPARRLASAASLVERLETLEARRARRNELNQERERAELAERRLAAPRSRLPWVAGALITLAAGLVVSLFLYNKSLSERDRAIRQASIADSVNRFLANDLLGRSDPFQSGKSEETLVEAVKQAASHIDRQFREAPEVAARLHQTIARALDNRSDFPDARSEYERASGLFVQVQGRLSPDAIAVQLQLASMEARTYQKESVPLARSIITRQESLMGRIARPRQDLPVWLASARGTIALIDNDAKTAVAQFQAAYDGASKLAAFDENARLAFQQQLAFAHVRSGDVAAAERLFRKLMASFSDTNGPESPSVLRVRLNLAQAYMIGGKKREAIEEANRIYPEYVARFGDHHELTMQLLTTRAQCEGSIGLWEDAIRDDMAIYNIAVEKQGPASFFAVATLSDAALAQCRGGHYREGEPNARKAYETAARAFGRQAGLTGGAAYTLASCAIASGKLVEAGRLLADIDTKVVAQLAGFPDWFANVELAQAEIAYRQGDYDAARRHLELSAPVFSKPGAEPYQKQSVEKLTAGLSLPAIGRR